MIFNPSGGNFYHYYAYLYKKKYWLDFIETLNQNLLELPPFENLIIIGPSGGYTLKTEFLKKFKKIIGIDIDFLSPYFFKKNHPNIQIKWIKKDLFTKKLKTDTFFELVNNNKNALVLFSNVLGQFPLVYKSKEFEARFIEFQKSLNQFFENKYFISYHDRISSKSQPMNFREEIFNKCIPVETLAETFYISKNIDVNDHLTSYIFPEKKRKACVWQIKPNQYQIIEIVKSF